MHSRRILMALAAAASLAGLGVAPCACADDAASPSELAAPRGGLDNAVPQLGDAPGPTMILIPDTDENGVASGSSGTVLILVPRRVPGTAPQTPDAAPPRLPSQPSPALVPDRHPVHIIEA
ncbi:MAG TPA: hypothetical protein VGI14_10015 [Casimicrobiaceae bacterium]|jgi:hypothetical protein